MSSILEIRHLRTLRAIEETGSMAAAARMISLTQSALSHQLKQLETHYEIPLFTRNTRPMTLTGAGRKLLELANNILPHIDEMEEKLKTKTAHTGHFHVAIECHNCFDWLLPALNHVRKHWPGLDVDAQMTFDALNMLKAGELDIVITSDPVKTSNISFMALFQYEAKLLMSPHHPLSDKGMIEPTDLRNETLITYPVSLDRLDVYQHFLRPAGLEIKNRRTSELTDMIIQHVDSQRGITVLPDWVLLNHRLTENLISKSLGRGLYRTVYVAVKSEDANNVALKDFIDIAPCVINRLKK